MSLAKCPNGHYYRDDIYPQCNQCLASISKPNIPPVRRSNSSKTQPMSHDNTSNSTPKGDFMPMIPKPNSPNNGNALAHQAMKDWDDDWNAPEIGSPNINIPQQSSYNPNALEPNYDSDKTIVIRPKVPSKPKHEPTPTIHTTHLSASDVDKSDEMEYVVGWLIVLEGIGRGSDFRLSYGANRIGRSKEMEICLDFNGRADNSISRDEHASIIYDDMSGDFFITVGRTPNLPRLNGQIIMSPTNIKNGDVIQVGTTKLWFVALCGSEFKW